jgi:hypothetical protein
MFSDPLGKNTGRSRHLIWLDSNDLVIFSIDSEQLCKPKWRDLQFSLAIFYSMTKKSHRSIKVLKEAKNDVKFWKGHLGQRTQQTEHLRLREIPQDLHEEKKMNAETQPGLEPWPNKRQTQNLQTDQREEPRTACAKPVNDGSVLQLHFSSNLSCSSDRQMLNRECSTAQGPCRFRCTVARSKLPWSLVLGMRLEQRIIRCALRCTVPVSKQYRGAGACTSLLPRLLLPALCGPVSQNQSTADTGSTSIQTHDALG